MRGMLRTDFRKTRLESALRVDCQGVNVQLGPQEEVSATVQRWQRWFIQEKPLSSKIVLTFKEMVFSFYTGEENHRC